MLEFLGAPQNLPFSVAIGVMFGIAAVEVVGTLLGAGVSQLLDSALPDFDADVDVDADLDLDADAAVSAGSLHGPGPLMQVLTWLHVGRVPVLVLLILFLTAFGVIGLALQSVVSDLTGRLLPAALAALPAAAGAVPAVRVVGGWIARVIPKEETSAVSRQTFVGRIATVVIGTARAGSPAQARLRDEHGRTHYVMVEPDLQGDQFPTGSEVLLVKVAGPRFRAIRPPSDLLGGDGP